MRCITAICPAGPPKLSAATRAQTRTASPKGTPCGGIFAARGAGVSMMPLFLVVSFIASLTRLSEILVKMIEHGGAAGNPVLVVVRGHADPGDQSPDPVYLGAGELCVLEVDIVYDLGDRAKGRVFEVRPREQ